ncbi:MAG: SNF2-related protein [Parcubacteria group bacterium GW2011_GWA2_49_9]|nr:MAG: SNF2-related protein [Parcubacteria group bacterium GW2011_GWA2_49_9]
MPTALAVLAARARSRTNYEYKTGRSTKSRTLADLTLEETVRINALLKEAKEHLDLTTDLTPDYDIRLFDEPKEILLVDFSFDDETLSIHPALDYGCFIQNVTESVYVGRQHGRLLIKHRGGFEHPGDTILIINGKNIHYASIEKKTELALFKRFYEQDIGLNRGGTRTLKGLANIAEFYDTHWAKLSEHCEKSECEIRFARDTLSFEQDIFRADVSIDAKTDTDWLAFDAACYCGPDRLSIADLNRFFKEGHAFWRRQDGRLSRVTNIEEIERFVGMLESFEERENGQFEGRLYHAPEIEYVMTSSPHYTATRGKGFARFLKEIKAGKPVKPVRLSKTHEAFLRPYQKEGVEWLYFLRSYHFAGVLADDMGLGKTIQTLVLLEKERMKGKPSLVVCPKTLLYNWQIEASRFAPTLVVAVVDGTPREREALIANATAYDLLITGYATLKKDGEAYKKAGITFNYCVLDEAQFIKNHATKSAQVAKEVDADHRLALTGTPLENSVSEIWSIFDFLMPGFLGSYKTFAKRFHKPIMERGDAKALELLRKKVECFMLRRTKGEVLKELPPKVEQTSHCRLSAAQSLLYQEVLSRVKSDMFKTVKERGFEKSRIHIFAGLMKLRQVCNHPVLLLKGTSYRDYESAKLDMFNELVEEVCENKRKVLVFSQFTGMLDILSEELRSKNVPHLYLSGKTEKRQELVEKFNADPTIHVFLISLRAGGTGLNLTAADTVIIFDPWWNPSVENQAIDRAHRIGQKQSVNVYRLITTGTIEEKIVALQQKKKKLFDALIGESKDLFQKLTWEDVQELFR